MSDEGPDSDPPEEIRFLEFYCGVGGWTMALRQAVEKVWNSAAAPSLRCCAALDHSDLCMQVYQHNLVGSVVSAEGKSRRRKRKSALRRIEELTVDDLIEWDADVWMMSPPCQPHTRQHDNQAIDMRDPRSASFLHLCDLVEQLPESHLPHLIFLENVVGFESSGSCERWLSALQERSYAFAQFHLQPTQVGLPNDRPRYYCVAVRPDRNSTNRHTNPLLRYLRKCGEQEASGESISPPSILHTSLEELGVLPEDSIDDAKKKLPPIKHFLNDETTDELFLSEKVLEKSAAWCLDVVKPHDARSACFTSSYGKFLRGTGSVLYVGQRSARTFALEAPEQRQFDANWAAGLSCTDLRHFSGVEIALLLGFPPSFRFPAHVTVKQQWKLLGNSLSVRVAAVVVEFGLRVLWNAHPAAER